jgi:hypothetical protein
MTHHTIRKASFYIIAFGALFYGYLYFIDGTYINKPVTYQSDLQALKTDKTTYHHGDEIGFDLSFCKYKTIPVAANWMMVDGIKLPFSQVMVSVPPGCYGTENGQKVYVRIIGTVPGFIDNGVYHLEGTATYRINAIKEITYKLKTTDFEVVGKYTDQQ